MAEEKKWVWEFQGFKSDAEWCPVQRWFNDLPYEAKEEIRDIVGFLRVKTKSRWQKPTFDPLEGSCGISELRPDNVTLDSDGKVEEVTYRIYGYFGPQQRVYTFLHGTRKDVKNDEYGKQIACERFREIKLGLGGATVHRFEF
ncbi:MAG: hypothetical protein ACRD2O_00650 [Terriglobia bacterium]